MKLVFRPCLYLSLLLMSVPAVAETNIAGIKLPDHYSVNGQSLSLNGAGIRSKFFVKVYVGALYLENRPTNADDIVAMQGAKSMQMHVLYKEIEAKKITDGSHFDDNGLWRYQGVLFSKHGNLKQTVLNVRTGGCMRLDSVSFSQTG